MAWDEFQKHFKNKYLTKLFYDEKEKAFHDLKLGKMTMDKFVTKFTSLKYGWYICEEKAKVQHFVSSLLFFMKEMIEFNNPRTMDEVIQKDHIFYQ